MGKNLDVEDWEFRMEKEGLGLAEWVDQSKALSLESSVKDLNSSERLLKETRVVGQKGKGGISPVTMMDYFPNLWCFD